MNLRMSKFKTIPFKMLKKMRYSGINTVSMHRIGIAENCTMLMKEINGLNKWRPILSSGIEELEKVKISVSPKLIYEFSTISIKITVRFLWIRTRLFENL